jgi:hypothetical protein
MHGWNKSGVEYGLVHCQQVSRTKLQALALVNDCYKYIMDLTTNGVVITDAIKFVQTSKEKLTIMSAKDEDDKESKEPDYDEDED